MSVSINISNMEEFAEHLTGKLRERCEKALDGGLQIISNRVRTEAVKLIMRGPKTGKMYGDHQASAPGEPPASIQGDGGLAGRILVRKVNGGYEVVAASPYAYWLEFGTTRMAARPFMSTAFSNTIPDLGPAIREAWQQHIDERTKT